MKESIPNLASKLNDMFHLLRESVMNLRQHQAALLVEPHRQTLATGIILFVFMVVALWLSLRLNIWLDEAYSLVTTQDGLGGVLRRWSFERQAPLYFVLLSVIRLIDDSILLARVLSTLAMVGFLAFIHVYVRMQTPRFPSSLVVFLFAVHPYTLWAATEIRVYALGLFMTGGMLVLQAWAQKEDFQISPVRSVLIGAVWAAALYTVYYTAFVVAGIVLSWLVIGKREALRPTLISLLTCTVLFLPFASYALQHLHGTSADMSQVSALGGIATVYGRLKWFVFPLGSHMDSTASRFCGYVIFALITGGTVSAIKWGKLSLRTHGGLLMVIAVTGLLYTATSVFVGPEVVMRRHAFALFPALLLFLVALFSSLPGALNRKLVYVGALALLSVLFVWTNLIDHSPLAKDGDYERAAHYIESNEKAGEPIVLFNSEALLPFQYYYDGPNQLLPIPRPPSTVRYDPGRFVIPGPAWVVAAFSRLPEDHQVVWFFDNFVNQYGPTDYNRHYLDSFLDERYTVLESKDFHSSRVSRLRSKTSR
jgi:hypothetical protein